MFTGHGNIETAVECIKLGAYDYLTKPVKLDELELVLDKAIEKNRLRLENINLRMEFKKLDNQQDHRPQPGHQAGAGDGPALGAGRRARPDFRRKRHRQGTRCPRRPRCQPAGRANLLSPSTAAA